MDFKRGVLIAIALVVVASVIAAGAFNGADLGGGFRSTSNQIGIIRIEGPIVGGSGGASLLGGASVGADEILAYLHEAQENPDIKAVVIRMNSPGGSAAASQEIGEEIKRLRQLGKPVVTSISDVGASGGYWIAATTDKIVSNPAAMTGSIGVIIQLTHYEELYEKLGIEVETIKSGPNKDVGSSARELQEKERELLQAMVDDIYGQFVDVVAKGRNMEVAEVRKIADGRPLTASQAYDLGLIDAYGTFYDAVDEAALMAKIDNYELYEFGGVSPFGRIFTRLGAALGGGVAPFQRATPGVPSNATLVRWLLYQGQGNQPR